MLLAAFRTSSRHVLAYARAFSTGSLHVTLQPLEGDNEGIFMLSLTREGARNAIGRQMLRELRESICMLEKERTTRCVVIRSTVDRAFCAGADLKERAMMSQQEAERFVSELRATFTALEGLPMPTVAVVEGYALGGGAELALSCDMRVGGRFAQFAFPETRLGIIPRAVHSASRGWSPRSRAKELIFTGRMVDAPEAYSMGLLDYAVDSDSALEEGLRLARQIAQGAPLALRLAKEAVNQGVEADLQTGLKLEESLYAQVLPSKDRLEGLKAFGEKRKPVFTGE